MRNSAERGMLDSGGTVPLLSLLLRAKVPTHRLHPSWWSLWLIPQVWSTCWVVLLLWDGPYTSSKAAQHSRGS